MSLATLHALCFWFDLTLHDAIVGSVGNGGNGFAPTDPMEVTSGPHAEGIEGTEGTTTDDDVDDGQPIILTTGPATPSNGTDGRCDVAGSHWRQAAVAVDPPRQVVVGQVLEVDVKVGEGLSGGIHLELV